VGDEVNARNGRNETDLERCDRNLVELLQEVRVVQTGVQVLFAFLLTAPLTPVFQRLDGARRAEYFVTLSLSATAAVLLIAPTAYHRLLFRWGDKEFLVLVANRLTLAGLVAVGLSMVGAMVFVADVLFAGWAAALVGVVAANTCVALWALLPLLRRRELSRRGARRRT
jgi:uncharacterized protein DUF6328